MPVTSAELKRKLFHHLSLVYLGLYAFTPRVFALTFLSIVLAALGAVEFLRLRRPEVNAWFLGKFGGIHRPEEIMKPSGIFWTLLGSWLTMLVFVDRRIVCSALGFLALGDAAAAIGGQQWGSKVWAHNPRKTYVGSACFAAVSFLWATMFLRWPVALVGSVAGAWIESRPLPYNDNLWVPLLSGLVLSLLSLGLGKH